ncbi:MAG: PglZ domain-containing protein [Methanotrichaceae archaeon]
MSLGDSIISDLLKENYDRYILLDPSGWLSDPTFVDSCGEYGIMPISVGEPTESSLAEVRDLASKKERHQTMVILVGSNDDADSWQSLLGPSWRMKDVQPSSVFPCLDPEISKHLSPAQAAGLLPVIFPDHPVLDPRRSAEIILEILFGLDAEKLENLDYFLESAFALHLKGQIPDRSWIEAISGSFPSIPSSKVSPKDALMSLDSFTMLVEELINTGRISPERRTMFRQMVSGTSSTGDASVSISERLGLDPTVIKDQVRKMSWECMPLTTWLEKSQILAKLSLAEELFKDPELRVLREFTEKAFSDGLAREYFKLQQTPWHWKPPMVHKILPFIQAHHKKDKVALIVVDCLSTTFWLVMRWSLRSHFYIEPALEASTFAWIPTLTTVSRQSIFSTRTPVEMGQKIKSTSGEESWWDDFWVDKGFQLDRIQFINVAEKKVEDVQLAIHDQDIRRLALIFNDIDELVHSSTSISTLNTENLMKLIDNWVSVSFGPILRDLLLLGWVVFVTSDHGAQRIRRDVGNIREGVFTERTGQRARIYPRLNFAAESKAEGALWDGRGTLPENYIALLAPPGTGYGLSFGWGHGGASWEEVIVPFIKFERTKS